MKSMTAAVPTRTVQEVMAIVADDYRRFPQAQTYALYAPDVYFKDPVYEFRGLDQYQKMIGFITTWFADLRLELHDIRALDRTIRTEWTMRWRGPLPWRPAIAVSGWTELQLNEQGQIASHRDWWHISRWDLIRQHFPF
ncbi:MAG: DUF2358 domain-containing protein [Pseudanabaenaceae cyanobacterium]